MLAEPRRARRRTRGVRRALPVLAAAAPAVVLAAAGLAHPGRLDVATAGAWWRYHVLLLPLFPLLAVTVWGLVRGWGGPVAVLARLAAYGYATCYTALDLLAGVAAGVAVETAGRRSQVSLDLGRLGVDLGAVGEWCLVAATVTVAAGSVRRAGRRAVLGAALLVGGALAFRGAHVYWPAGGLALLGFAAGAALLAATTSPVGAAPGR